MQSTPRPAEAGDLPFLLKLEELSFPKGRRESHRSIRGSLSSPHQEVWIAVASDGSPAGALFLRFRGGRCRVYSIAVDPEFRGRGLGRVLLGTALIRARKRGCRIVHLEVDPANQGAVNLYRSMGFVPDGERIDFYGPGESALRWIFNLSSETDASH